MPFNISRSAHFPDKEILKFPTGLHAIKSVVLDGTDFVNTATVANSRYFVPAGTILTQSVTNTDKHVEYKGTGTISGILARPVDMLAQVTAGSEPAPMFFHECVFATSALVGFTQYASALVHDLNTCKFE
jgi:hypothetical protein